MINAVPKIPQLLAKVCGVRTETDVDAALRAGADFVGFVSHPPSPRHLGDADIVRLAAPLAGRTPEEGAAGVLVTVNREPEDVEALMAASGLFAVQLCGDEDPGFFYEAPFEVFRRVAASDDSFTEMDVWRPTASLFVIDHPGYVGGAGIAVDREIAAELAAHGPCMLAGGIRVDSLEDEGLDAMLAEAPIVGVDASSGLESTRGVKDHDLIRRYVAAVHQQNRMWMEKSR